MGEEYEVLGLIGRGSFGQIHKVRRVRDGLILARKEISFNRMSTKEKEQLTAEFSILSKLQHPNIVQYYNREVNKLDQSLYIYMEYCGGGDLSQRIKECRANGTLVPENFVWSIFAQIVLALYKCHNGTNPPSLEEMVDGWDKKKVPVVTTALSGAGGARISGREVVVHRDLKPENVFLDHETCVKLGDFGLSRILASDQHMATTYVGTPYYMSPEIVCDLPYTSRSDIWSLGCVIYELCALTPPFDAKSLPSLCQKIQSGRYSPIPSSYSPELRRVIDSCLRTNPSERPDTAKLLDLQIMRTMRRELEAIDINKALNIREESLKIREKEADERRKNFNKLLEEASLHIRKEIDAELRKVWDEKAESEIRRRVDIEVQRRCAEHEAEMKRQYKEALEAMRIEFQTSLEKQVTEQVEKRVQDELLTAKISGLGMLERNRPKDGIESILQAAIPVPAVAPVPTSIPTIVRSSSLDDLHTSYSRSEDFMPASPMDISMVSPMQAMIGTTHRRQQQASPLQARKTSRLFTMARSSSVGILGADDDSEDDEPEHVPIVVPQRPPARPFPLNTMKSAPVVPRTGLQRVYSAPVHPNMMSNPSTPPRGRRVSGGGTLRPNPSAENRQLSPNRKLSFTGTQQPIAVKTAVGVKAAVMNNTRAKSLLELQKDRTKKERTGREKENDSLISVEEVPVWDPETEGDDLPSPFLVRKRVY